MYFNAVVQSLNCVWVFCNPMGCSLPGSSVHGISQARILEWVAISFSMYFNKLMDLILFFKKKAKTILNILWKLAQDGITKFWRTEGFFPSFKNSWSLNPCCSGEFQEYFVLPFSNIPQPPLSPLCPFPRLLVHDTKVHKWKFFLCSLCLAAWKWWWCHNLWLGNLARGTWLKGR